MRRLMTAAGVLFALLSVGPEAQVLEKYAFLVMIDGAMSRPELSRIFDDIEAAAEGRNCHPTDPAEFGCEYYVFTEDPNIRAEVLMVINGDVFQSVSNLLDRSTVLNASRWGTTDVLDRATLLQRGLGQAVGNNGATHVRILWDGDRANQVPLLPTFEPAVWPQ